jgi:Na+/melibiose symporter-like transporter
LWNFAPGSGTPLQYYLQDTMHTKNAQWGQRNAIFSAFFIPTFLVFGVLCRKFPLKTLLFWGTVVAIPQMVPLLFLYSVMGALIAAVSIGVNCASHRDNRRSCRTQCAHPRYFMSAPTSR